jgi:hypothetical protein
MDPSRPDDSGRRGIFVAAVDCAARSARRIGCTGGPANHRLRRGCAKRSLWLAHEGSDSVRGSLRAPWRAVRARQRRAPHSGACAAIACWRVTTRVRWGLRASEARARWRMPGSVRVEERLLRREPLPLAVAQIATAPLPGCSSPWGARIRKAGRFRRRPPSLRPNRSAARA